MTRSARLSPSAWAACPATSSPPRIGSDKAKQWLNVVTGKATPVRPLAEKYLKEHEGKLGKSTLNNLNMALRELYEFGGKDVLAETVDRAFVAALVTDFLPNRTSPKAPNGQGPATIKKKVSQLTLVWRWAMKRGHLPYAKETPWDEQAPSGKEVMAAKAQRRLFTPDELKALLEAAPMGKPVGDIIRVAVLTGVRLEEVASLFSSPPHARAVLAEWKDDYNTCGPTPAWVAPPPRRLPHDHQPNVGGGMPGPTLPSPPISGIN